MGATICTWGDIPADEVGKQIYIPNHSDKTLQIFGSFTGGAVVSIEGSNDPRAKDDPASAVWWTVLNAQGNALSVSSAGGHLILDNPIYIRPKVVGGDISTAITAILCAKRG